MYAMSERQTPAQEVVRAAEGAPHFLVHNEGDLVAVAVQDVAPGLARVVYLDSERSLELQVAQEIPFGHKVALTHLDQGDDVIEYAARIGVTRQAIEAGALVHVHNVRSARWQTSG
jgi:(2R)-sulfolactate sulfo-lyase subunit alpha